MQQREAGSFRDPSGFLYWEEGRLMRQVNTSYRPHYECLMGSGLYNVLVDKGLLIPHREEEDGVKAAGAYKLITPDIVSPISYPYEWSFSQFKDAARLTLQIQQIALGYGMTLKDASAYNIQFRNGQPVLIDTLSLETYEEGRPWIAYRQFCQHFLAPLALMAWQDVRLAQLLRVYMDGIPLDLASKLLPGRTRLNFSLLMNIHLHARSQKQHEDRPRDGRTYQMSRQNLVALIESLEKAVENLTWKAAGTEWGDYYAITNYSEESFQCKKELVDKYLDRINPGYVWDLGANTGVFSRLASDRQILTVAFDIDPVAVEKNYLYCREHGEQYLLPLWLDLTNPSPGLGWANTERQSILQRSLPDTVMALALVHHLAISNNVPLEIIADFFSKLADNLIIEFVPKSDSQVQRLLVSREDIFDSYDRAHFESQFSRHFEIVAQDDIAGTHRSMYLMARK